MNAIQPALAAIPTRPLSNPPTPVDSFDVIIHVTDPEVLAHMRVLQNPQARSEFLGNAVKLGVKVIDATGPLATTADVEQRFQALEQRLAHLLDDGHIKDLFDPDDPDSPIGRIRGDLTEDQQNAAKELRSS